METNTLIITYKNGKIEQFYEKQLNCSEITVKGHASKLIEVWKRMAGGVYSIDNYNAVLLDEIITIRVS